jgi:Ni,Fe-hydrogenase III component G
MSSLETLSNELATRILSWDRPEANRTDMVLVPEHHLPVISHLHQIQWGYLAAITGLDHGPDEAKLEVLYHYCSGAEVLTLRVRVNREQAALPSICSIVPHASVFERELSEMFGITVYGTPDDSRLFLPDDWPMERYPLRKDVVAEEPDNE